MDTNNKEKRSKRGNNKNIFIKNKYVNRKLKRGYNSMVGVPGLIIRIIDQPAASTFSI
jgi:hypothetical protein